MNTSAIYTAILNVIYPVGSIIQNYDDPTNPGDRIPGTSWARIEDRFLVGQGTFGTRAFNGGSSSNLSVGGESTVALTPDNLPSHSHTISYYYGSNRKGGADPDGWITSDRHDQIVFEASSPTQYTELSARGEYNTSETGDNNYRHNNMPPYVKVYGWYRYA